MNNNNKNNNLKNIKMYKITQFTTKASNLTMSTSFSE